MNNPSLPIIVITPRGMTSLGEWRELWAARDLWWFLVRRDLKTRYAQSVLGLGWAVVQPLFTTFILTLIFSKLMKVPSDGVPYPVWSLAAVVLWTFFQTAVNESGNCLAANMGVITKVYFPRLILPLAAVAGKIFDLLIMFALLGVSMIVCYPQLAEAQCHPQFAALWAIPAAVVIIIVAALAAGLWLAGLSVQYRDVRVAQGLMLTVIMYATPIFYSSGRIYTQASVPSPWRELYFANPLAGAIEALRAALFSHNPTSLRHVAFHLGLGAVVAVVGLLGGLWCFRRAENLVADVA
jgi:lipopolysaccharide transport system permease protein